MAQEHTDTFALCNDILRRARAAGIRLATAESCTGGMIAAALTAPPGASDAVQGGVVSYANDAKAALLGVRAATLAAHGAVSEPVAREMAEGALTRLEADLAVSVTGIAGPGGSLHKPEGRVCFGLARRGGATTSETVDFGAPGRDAVRAAACTHALTLLRRALG